MVFLKAFPKISALTIQWLELIQTQSQRHLVINLYKQINTDLFLF